MSTDTRTVDVTPRWIDILPIMITVLQNPDASAESLRAIEDELRRMAKAADKYNDTVNGQG